MGHQRSVWLLAQQTAVAGRDDEQPAVGQPVDAHRERGKINPGHHLRLALAIDRHDLLRTPVSQPQTVLMPAQRFTKGKAIK